MAVDEFVTAYTEGLRAILVEAGFDKDESHIEDLTAASFTYSQSVFQFVSNLPYRKPCKCKKD